MQNWGRGVAEAHSPMSQNASDIRCRPRSRKELKKITAICLSQFLENSQNRAKTDIKVSPGGEDAPPRLRLITRIAPEANESNWFGSGCILDSNSFTQVHGRRWENYCSVQSIDCFAPTLTPILPIIDCFKYKWPSHNSPDPMGTRLKSGWCRNRIFRTHLSMSRAQRRCICFERFCLFTNSYCQQVTSTLSHLGGPQWNFQWKYARAFSKPTTVCLAPRCIEVYHVAQVHIEAGLNCTMDAQYVDLVPRCIELYRAVQGHSEPGLFWNVGPALTNSCLSVHFSSNGKIS